MFVSFKKQKKITAICPIFRLFFMKNQKIMKEVEIMNAIIEYLLWKKVYVWRSNNAPIFDITRKVFRAMPKHALKGVADILGVLPDGKFLAIEVKADESKKLSDAQKEFLSNILTKGGVAFIATGLPDIEKYLSNYLN